MHSFSLIMKVNKLTKKIILLVPSAPDILASFSDAPQKIRQTSAKMKYRIECPFLLLFSS